MIDLDNTKTIKLSIIIVNWQVKEYLKKCLKSIDTLYKDKSWFEVIVVDNASTDDTVPMVRESFPWVRLIANLENKGFARANNQGINISHGEYLLFLNPDTEIVEDSFFKIINYLDSHEDVGIVGCKLIYPDGSLQKSCRRFPTIDVALWQHHGEFLIKDIQKIMDNYFMKNMDYNIVQEVDQPMGAVLMVKKKALNDIGGYMDEKYFMFFDEVDLCYRIKQKGWKIVYFPDTKVIHHRAKSVEFAFSKGNRIDNEFHKSMFKFLSKHYKHEIFKKTILKIIFYCNKLMKKPARAL